MAPLYLCFNREIEGIDARGSFRAHSTFDQYYMLGFVYSDLINKNFGLIYPIKQFHKSKALSDDWNVEEAADWKRQ